MAHYDMIYSPCSPRSFVFSSLYLLSTFYCPLRGVPKMPTASSAQIRKRATRRAVQTAIRYLILVIFLITNSHIRPVPSSSAPAIIKSNRVQFTSFVNCIVINGMSNRTADMSTMMISLLLFCIIIFIPLSISHFYP